MEFMSSDSSEEDYGNSNDCRSTDSQNRKWGNEKNREKANNKTEFEERIRNKLDLERDDRLRRVIPNLKIYKTYKEKDASVVNQTSGILLNELIEKKINQRLEELLSSQNEKRENRIEASKTEVFREEKLIEQKVQARLTEIKEKKKKELTQLLLNEIAKNKNEIKTDLQEIEKRMTRMFQESIQRHKQQFDKEKDDEIQFSLPQEKKAFEYKWIKNELLSEEDLIEKKVQAQLTEIEEKKRKEEEKENLFKDIVQNKTDLIELENRMAKIIQQSLQQNQKFEKEKETIIVDSKKTLSLIDKRSHSQISANKQDFPNNFDDTTISPSINPKSNRLDVNFGRSSGEYQILLLGGTGTGKSTLINTMANYFLGGSLEQPKVVIPTKYFKKTESGYSSRHSESALDDVTKSKTTKCLTYTFSHPKNRSLKFVFIDSPGLNDTGGTEIDNLNIEVILNAAINANSLSALIVIANGSEPRVTPSIRNILARLGNNLPDDLIDRNLLLVLTKCSRISASFSEDAFEKEISKPKEVFYMDNQAFCSDPRTWQMDEDAFEALKLKWKQSHRTFDNLLKTITGMSITSTNSFQNMKDLRNELKSEIATICQDIANIQKVQDSLEAAQIAAQKNIDKKEAFANYTKVETLTLKKIVPANYNSTVCITHFLQDIICHQNCGLEFTGTIGTDALLKCSCIGKNGYCHKCGCDPLSHYHAMVALETVTETIEKVLEDMKSQYDSADADYHSFCADSDIFQTTLVDLQADVDQKYLKIAQLCHGLSKICSRFNFVDELHANIENMKLEASLIRNADIRKNAENEIVKFVNLVNDLSAKQYKTSICSTSNIATFHNQSSLDPTQNLNRNGKNKHNKL